MLLPLMPSSGPGWVYVFENEDLPDTSKIGRMQRTAEKRAPEVTRSYGTASPFTVYTKHFTPDAAAVEWIAHRMLKKRRYPRCELFAVAPDRAAETVKKAVKAYRPPSVWSYRLRRLLATKPSLRRPGVRVSDGLIVGGALALFVAAIAWIKPLPASWMPPPVAHVVTLIEAH